MIQGGVNTIQFPLMSWSTYHSSLQQRVRVWRLREHLVDIQKGILCSLGTFCQTVNLSLVGCP